MIPSQSEARQMEPLSLVAKWRKRSETLTRDSDRRSDPYDDRAMQMDYTAKALYECASELEAALKAISSAKDDEIARLRQALDGALRALPDSDSAGPDGTGYRYAWDECTGDEQEWVKQVRGECRAALSESR